MSDLLPPNALPQERALSLATARLADVPMPILTLWDPETCPAAILPWLAWALSVDEWNANWPEAQKRAAIAASRAVHEKKGTAQALKLAVGSLGFDVEISEWFQQEPPGDPYTFEAFVIVDQEPIPNEGAFDQIVSTASAAKNLRSHMTGVNIKGLTAGTIHVGATACLGEIVTLGPEPVP